MQLADEIDWWPEIDPEVFHTWELRIPTLRQYHIHGTTFQM
jgi:hypothetical protein